MASTTTAADAPRRVSVLWGASGLGLGAGPLSFDASSFTIPEGFGVPDSLVMKSEHGAFDSTMDAHNDATKSWTHSTDYAGVAAAQSWFDQHETQQHNTSAQAQLAHAQQQIAYYQQQHLHPGAFGSSTQDGPMISFAPMQNEQEWSAILEEPQQLLIPPLPAAPPSLPAAAVAKGAAGKCRAAAKAKAKGAASPGMFSALPVTPSGSAARPMINRTVSAVSEADKKINSAKARKGVSAAAATGKDGQPKKPAKRSREQSSKYRGVSRCSKDGRWQARIRIGATVKYLGRFKDEIDAAKRYDQAAVRYHGKRAVPNFPNAVTTEASMEGATP